MAAVRRVAPLLKLGVLVLVILAGTLTVRLTPVGEYFTREGIAQAIRMLRGSIWAPLIYVIAYTAATALAFPGSVLTMAGGVLFGVVWGTVYTTIGANLGANLAFLLARSLGRGGIERLFGSRLKGLDRGATQHGFRALLTLRLIPLVPFNALNFGAGLTAIAWRSYALATIVGILPGTAVYTFFADALLQGSQEASRAAFLRVLVAGALLVLLSMIPVIVKKLHVKLPGATGVLAAFSFLGAAAPAPAQELPDHGRLTALLQDVVVDERVDYAQLKRRTPELEQYLDQLGRTRPAALEAAGRSPRLAFWINAYNACMLEQVIDHYPIRKASFPPALVNAVAGRPDNSVWQIPDVFTRKFCRVAGAPRSLDEIEHEILRPMGEPRVHFVINCAARGCPPLAPQAYTADRLDAQLEDAVRRFLSDPQHFRIERGSPAAVRVNKVLEWFGQDFGGEEGVRRFLAKYLAPADAALLLSAETRIEYLDYDWTLNDVETT
ncbi:MAG: DUF547 domain-containing protein [Gemmatimonadetes bacterium]|nr:DUF547 domain-containing protein [Gemmatimonadota bacterium]